MSSKKKRKEYPSVAKYLSKITKKDFIKSKFVARIEQVEEKQISNEESQEKRKRISNEYRQEEENDLQKRVRLAEENLKLAKQMLRKSSEINLEKDFKINQLTEKIANTLNSTSPLPFEDFKSHFEPADLKSIRSIKSGQKNDSSFILRIMKSLYKNDTAKLKKTFGNRKKIQKRTENRNNF